jgi:predicted ATPase/DNA-binding SARP family transcriptional activator/tetratricopeptide (TPR) repeat protein
VAVLGALEVTRDGRRLTVPVGKTSELVVRLALEAGELVRADRLVEDLWGDGRGARRNTLQSKVAMLRRALGDPGAIISRNGSYSLAVDAAAVDALAVVGSVAIATGMIHGGDDLNAAELCATTLSLFRGEVLQAAGEGDWVAPHRTRLEEARMKLLEIQFASRLRLGDDDVIGELDAAVATYPFQESLWELLILAQYRAGRQADALASYQKVRTQLATELGLDPGPQLKVLEQRILVHDESLNVQSSPGSRAKATRSNGNLPSMSVELVGRESEVAALSDLLTTNRLVEIVGPGGIGKTAVAVAVGRGLVSSVAVGANGIWLARLESAVTADQVLDVLVSAVDGPGGEAALFERLSASSAVVILDNCEHVVEEAAALAVRLLDAAPGLRILCTSQVALDVDSEVVFELTPLALADSVALFTRRAAAQRLSHGVGTDSDAVLDLCRSLDGLPLAIELAAARTKTLSVEEITRRLDDPFRVLLDPSSRRPERRRSLRSTIAWSYDLLFPDDQRGLWALATFAGGAPLPAVESVLEALDVPAAAAINVVGRLASRSLVMVDDAETWPGSTPSGSASSHSVRYRLLDSIRAFALREMTDAGLADRARAAHSARFADAAASSTAGVRSGLQAEYLAFARAERANIEAALEWCATHDPELSLRMVNGFGWAWVVLGDSRGARRILAALDGSADTARPYDRATALLLAAWIEASTGDLDLARQHVAAASEVADATHDTELQARCSYYLAYVISHHGEFHQALQLTDCNRAVYETLDRPWDQAANALFAARAALSAGDEPRAVEAAEYVRSSLGTVDDPWLHVRGEAILGELARLQHRFAEAVVHLRQAADTSGRLGFQQTEAYQLSSLGRAQAQAGDYLAGANILEEAVAKAQSTGDARLAALARVHLGRVLRALGQATQARTVLEAATLWHRDVGGGEQAALGECLLAAMDAADEVPGAPQKLRECLDRARDADDPPVEVFALDALARVAQLAGRTGTALELCDAADRRMESASHLITYLDRTDARWVRSTS